MEERYASLSAQMADSEIARGTSRKLMQEESQDDVVASVLPSAIGPRSRVQTLIIEVDTTFSGVFHRADRATHEHKLCAGVYVQVLQALEVISSSVVSN